MATLHPLRSWTGDIAQELRTRAAGARGHDTQQLILVDGEQVVGYVAVDILHDTLLVYELWILRAIRRRGCGKAALRLIATYAEDHRLQSVTVRPTPLDDSSDRASLAQWYRSLGFTASTGDPDVFTCPATALLPD